MVDADGGANMNLFVIGSAVFFKNSMIVVFDGNSKLVALPLDDLVMAGYRLFEDYKVNKCQIIG